MAARLLTLRALVLALLLAALGAFLAYLVLEVPVAAPPLPDGRVLLFGPDIPPPMGRAQMLTYWPQALVGAIVVAVVLSAAVVTALRTRRDAAPAGPLRLEGVPWRAVAVVAGFSLALVLAAFDDRQPLWVVALVGLIPWLPLAAVETLWKYRHYGAWAAFCVLVAAQVGHMGEHTVQVGQLLAQMGDLNRSHGVFGGLDFETVHFVWDSALWIALCFLLPRFGRGNPWLWVAAIAASIHEVEHLYLFWLYRTHFDFYMAGGFEGIMGYGGIIGSPLARPYLHFAYNALVTLPMVLAFVDEARRAPMRVARLRSAVGAKA